MESLGWLGDDVWLAHGIHFDDAAIETLAATGTGVAHCPSSNARLGAGIARTADLRDAGVPVGLGVDGAASNEACSLLEEARHALLFARARGGPQALTVRDALELATIGGARVLGWDDQIGSLEAGKLADIAVWRLDTWRTPTSSTRSPPWCSARPHRWSCCWSAAERWSSGTTWSPSTSTNSPNPRSARTDRCWLARVP